MGFSILVVLVVTAVTCGFVCGLFLTLRRYHRRRHNYQRGLAMVVLQIHLPPASEDVATKTRDTRDIVEENISKAVVLYNLLASIAEKKSFKTGYYGQAHLGFEIIAQAGFVYFYAVAPQELVAIVQQAIVSAYKGAKTEVVKEHNLFAPEANLDAVTGAELNLKREFAYPLATYVDSRQDMMRALLEALGKLGTDAGGGVQILLRPAFETWTKEVKSVVQRKIKKKQSNWLKDLLVGFVKAPDSDSGNANQSELSSVDRTLVENMEKKTTQAGFEVLIRLLVSKEGTDAKSIYDNLLAAFTLLDAPHSNSFKPTKVKDKTQFIADFNFRLFPQSKNQNILNATELATLFHLPDQTNIPTSQLERQASKQVDGPRNFLADGLTLGYNVFRDQRRPVILGDEDRMRHMYVVGQTGTGKSVFLENLALQDITAGKGFALVDPHGETAEQVLSRIPDNRLDDVIYFNPGNMDYPMGLNIFEHEDVDKQDFLIQEAITMLYKLYDPHQQGIMGPRYEYMFRNAAKLIMADPAGGTFIDIPKLFNDRAFVEAKLKHVQDQSVIDFWSKEIVDSARSSEFGDVKSWFVSKFSAFLSNTMMRNIIGQKQSSFDLRQIMDDSKILIVNLSQGLMGELNMKLLGMIFVTKFQIAAMGRANVAASQRADFTLYIDEFQNFATESFAGILSAARKYRLALVVANQHTTQLTDNVRDAVYGNVGTAISFRINAVDAENLIKQFYSPIFEIDDLTRLPVGHTVVRSLINSTPTAPFNMVTPEPPVTYDSADFKRVEQHLIDRHGRPREQVEAEIMQRLAVQAPPQPNFDPLDPPLMPGQLKPPTDDDFLDSWTKRKKDLKQELDRQKAFRAELERQRKRLQQLNQDLAQADQEPDTKPADDTELPADN